MYLPLQAWRFPQAQRPLSVAATAAATPQHAGPDAARLRLFDDSRLTSMAHELWTQVLAPGDTVVDATCGKGYDTAFLAAAVGPIGRVFAFDLQPEAVEATRVAVEAALPPEARPAELHCLCRCHSTLHEVVGTHAASLICFNLGYLPGGDKAIVTQESSTIAGVEAACEVLRPGGLLSMLCYIGHPGGEEEYAAVSALLEGLPPKFWVTSQIRLMNRSTAPVLLLAWKRSRPAGAAEERP
jgi:predicted methyltransferase